MARRPFASLLAVGGLGLLLAAALLLVSLPPPIASAIKRCVEPNGLCASLVRLGHSVGGPLLLALLPWSLSRGLGNAWRQWRATRRTLARLRSLGLAAPAGPLADLCAELRLAGVISIIDSEAPLAFCCGIWRPRIWVSAGTLALLSEPELAAVLRHERVHLRRLHPVQLLLARALAAAFPFLPIVRELAEALPCAQELAADRAVIRSGERQALGRALLALLKAGHPLAQPSLAPGMVGALDARLGQLTGLAASPARLSGRGILLTCLAFGLGLLLLRLDTLGPGASTLLALPMLPPLDLRLQWSCLIGPLLACGALQVGPAALSRLRRAGVSVPGARRQVPRPGRPPRPRLDRY